MKIKLLNIPVKENKSSSSEGQLAYFDDANHYLNEIKRVYSISNVASNVIRGHHAHKKLHQLIFCAYGSIRFLLDDGNEVLEVILNHPSKFLYVGPLVWHTMEWLIDNSVLVVLASENYHESDYIRSYDEFLRIVKNDKSSL
jgi:dTDP-4-dehydrorhamnose 3,5-epimerase-like enzyme